MEYRREIDGLRAVAVLPVILFHAGFDVFSGGFVGVDVFFVISGFLITSILIDELERDDFSIARFYERRARRILPALFVVLLACIPFAWMWMLPSGLKDFAQSVAATVLFSSNILFWRESGYFDTAAELKPLLHTWSLSVEEQYYLVFPVFLLLVWRFGRNRVFWLIVAIAAVSLLLSEYGWRNHPSANFFLAPTRAWELLAGSICAFLTVRRAATSSNLASAAGLALILFSIFAYDASTPFPSLYTLAPVVGTALVLLYARGGTFVARLLSTAPFVGVGLISYSAYLWHQPLFAFARIRSLTEPSQPLMATLAVLALVLAAFTWKYVEQPLRKRSGSVLPTRKSVFVASGAVGSLLIAVGVVGHIAKGFEGRLSPELLNIAKAAEDKPERTCHFDKDKPLPTHPEAPCYHANSSGDVDVLLIGDSHSYAISQELGERLREADIGYYNVSYSGCRPLKTALLYRRKRDECSSFVKYTLDYGRRKNVKAYVLTARYATHLSGQTFNNGESGVEFMPEEEKAIFNDGSRTIDILIAYEKDIRSLANESGVILVYPIPEAGWDVPKTLFHKVFFSRAEPFLSTSYETYKKRTAEVNSLFDKLVAELPNVYAARSYKAFCSDETGRCVNADANGIYYYDDDHPSNAGARLIAPIVLGAIKNALRGKE